MSDLHLIRRPEGYVLREEDVVLGNHHHFKGGLYTVVSSARAADESLELLVVYHSDESFDFWVRPAEEFYGIVEDPATGKKVLRFSPGKEKIEC